MAGDEDKAVLIMVTAGDRSDAERLGEGLVVEHLAAHCSVVPSIHSFYYSEDLLQRASEALLMVKTVKSRAGAIYEYLREHHSYGMPEMYELAIDGQVAKPGSER